jgi:glycerol-3-phosphate O-acyltransferase/dihydroxyacetone phosphate acyltransferase
MRQMPRSAAVSWIYDLVVRVFSLMVGLFFREIRVRGAWRIPDEGSVILVAGPHANQVGTLPTHIILLL